MAFKKFGDNEIMYNTMRAYPHSEFLIFDSNVYYNQRPDQIGTRNSRVRNVANGYVSLFELNIDRPEVTTGRYIGPRGEPEDGEVDTRIPDNGRIYPWISKDSAGASFKTVNGFVLSDESWNNEFSYGDILRAEYPLSASITREFISNDNQSPYTATHPSSSSGGLFTGNANYMALRSALNRNALRSQHYAISSSYGNKDTQKLNLIHIPSIFYGSKIKPGSVKLEWYYTGSLIGVVTDHNRNGELIQTYGPNSEAVQFNNEVAGVVMYEEGVIVLTGSWRLNNNKNINFKDTSGNRNPRWIYFGAGANDGQSRSGQTRFGNASYKLSFKGVTETQVLTMFAKAKKGEVNYSSNPTFLEHGQSKIFNTSSLIYEENSDLKLVNFVSSSYVDYSAPFKRQVYVSRVGIYDKNKNLIGVATLGSPILKEDDQDITFKLKIDL